LDRHSEKALGKGIQQVVFDRGVIDISVEFRLWQMLLEKRD
jgi:hypothetical protein